MATHCPVYTVELHDSRSSLELPVLNAINVPIKKAFVLSKSSLSLAFWGAFTSAAVLACGLLGVATAQQGDVFEFKLNFPVSDAGPTWTPRGHGQPTMQPTESHCAAAFSTLL